MTRERSSAISWRSWWLSAALTAVTAFQQRTNASQETSAPVKEETFVGNLTLLHSFRICKKEKSTKLFSIPNFLPLGLQTFQSSLLVFTSFNHSESTKLSPIRKVLNGKVRNFSPTELSSYTVYSIKLITLKSYTAKHIGTFWYYGCTHVVLFDTVTSSLRMHWLRSPSQQWHQVYWP